MSAPDPVDDLLEALMPIAPPGQVQPQADRAFRNHAAEAKQSSAPAWRVWSRWLEPTLVGVFVLIFVVWAFGYVLGG